jgi:hypothetical protein
MPKFIGPFVVTGLIGQKDPVTQVVNQVSAVKLQLPANYRLHPVFHVSLLKPYVSDGNTIATPDPVEVDTDGTPIFEAECIIQENVTKRGTPRHNLLNRQIRRIFRS